MSEKKFDWDPPSWLKNFEPKHVIFHDQEINVYEGLIDVSLIKLWRENDRTSLDIDHLASESGVQNTSELSDEKIIGHILKNGLHRITDLAKSIEINDIRVPLTLTYDRILLDGNRRFIACKYLLASKKKKEPMLVRAYCLKPNISKELKYKIISEMNFLPDHKEKWPQEVRAKYVRKVFYEYKNKYGEKKAIEKTTFLLDLDKADIFRFLEVLDMINEYLFFVEKKSAEARKQAEIFAREKFHFFEEFFNKGISKKEPSGLVAENKQLFYENLYKKNLISTTGIREFTDMLNYPSVRKIIKDEKETLDYAKAVYDDIVLPKRTSSKIERFCEWFEKLSLKEIKNISPQIKARLFKAFKRLGAK